MSAFDVSVCQNKQSSINVIVLGLFRWTGNLCVPSIWTSIPYDAITHRTVPDIRTILRWVRFLQHRWIVIQFNFCSNHPAHLKETVFSFPSATYESTVDCAWFVWCGNGDAVHRTQIANNANLWRFVEDLWELPWSHLNGLCMEYRKTQQEVEF